MLGLMTLINGKRLMMMGGIIKMNIQEIHERFEAWDFDNESRKIVLKDVENKPIHSIDVNDLIELWFNKADE